MQSISHLLSFLRGHPEAEAAVKEREARVANLIERVARGVVSRRLEAPAALFLELNHPLGFLVGQAALFARPFLSLFLPLRDLDAATEVLDDPKALERLVERIGELSAQESQ